MVFHIFWICRGVYTSRLVDDIQPSVNNKCPGVFFGFCRKLSRTKTQQSTDKASGHNMRIVFLRYLVFLTPVLTGVVSTLSYHLSSIQYTSSLFVPTSLFASASDTATNRVSCPLWSGRACIPTPNIWRGPILHRSFPADSYHLFQIAILEHHQRSNQTGKLCNMATNARTTLCLIIDVSVVASAAAVRILLFILPRPSSLSRKNFHTVIPGINADLYASVQRNSTRDRGRLPGLWPPSPSLNFFAVQWCCKEEVPQGPSLTVSKDTEPTYTLYPGSSLKRFLMVA